MTKSTQELQAASKVLECLAELLERFDNPEDPEGKVVQAAYVAAKKHVRRREES